MRAAAKRLAALCLAAALPAGAAGAADPWAGPVDPASDGALARCAAFYAILAPALPEGEGRDRIAGASETLIGALDARDRAARGETSPETPQPRRAVLDEMTTAVDRHRATLEARMAEGEDEARGFIAAEAEGCEPVAREAGVQAPGP